MLFQLRRHIHTSCSSVLAIWNGDKFRFSQFLRKIFAQDLSNNTRAHTHTQKTHTQHIPIQAFVDIVWQECECYVEKAIVIINYKFSIVIFHSSFCLCLFSVCIFQHFAAWLCAWAGSWVSFLNRKLQTRCEGVYYLNFARALVWFIS